MSDRSELDTRELLNVTLYLSALLMKARIAARPGS